MIITEELVKGAIRLVNPSALAILAAEGTTWGPRRVEGFLVAPGLRDPVMFSFGEREEWKPEWGPQRSFWPIAERKLAVALREGVPTSVVVATRPWVLKLDEYLYAGGTVRHGIGVAVSGAKGRVDETLAEMVLDAVVMLAMLDADRRMEIKKMRIEDQ